MVYLETGWDRVRSQAIEKKHKYQKHRINQKHMLQSDI